MDNRILENLNNIQQNYIAPFLWLHNENDEHIIAELRRIYNCGIRSVCLESRTHEEFCRDEWWADVRLILDECRKLNMNVWILDDKHFPTGYGNGIFEEKYKNLRPWFVKEVHVDVVGPAVEASVMADCHLEEIDDEFICVAACKHVANSDGYTEVIDITDGLSDGMVYFTLPEGMWRIVFVIKTRSGVIDWGRTYGDMIDPGAVDLLIKEIYQAHYDRFSEYFGNTLLGFFSDEPSFLNGTANSSLADTGVAFNYYPWQDRLKDEISSCRSHLTGLWFDIDGISDEVRYSFMNVITEEYRKNFGEKIGAWCREHGVMYIGHVIEDNNAHAKTGRGTGHYFRSLSGQDMSGVDVVLHQIVPGLTECSSAGLTSYKHMNNDFFHYYLAKLASSLAHIDPKKKGRAMCEIFGAYGWAEGTKIMKYLMDHMLVRGINYFVPHAFSPKPNDTDCPPNFYDSGRNPQYKFFKNNMDYLNRASHMLSDGKHISTCAILYDAENHWLNNDFLPLEKIAKVLYDNLYDYDIIPADYLDKIDDSGYINGEKCNLLIVPYSSTMANEVREKLKNVNIDIIGVSQGELKASDGFLEYVSLERLADYMSEKQLCDVRSDYCGIYLRYYHYTRNNAHIYMFTNEDVNNPINTVVTMSAFSKGKYIQYDAFDNRAYVKNADSCEIYISLPPYHSTMIIFGDVPYEQIPDYVDKKYTQFIEITPEFTLSTASGNSTEFKSYKVAKKLFNITGKDKLSYFSGHIKYETYIKLEKTDYILDLGYVGEVAELYLNDKLIGTRQIPPYQFEISKEDIEENNKLTIVVSNHNGYAVRDRFSKFLIFEASGLMGPIQIQKRLS